MLALDRNSEPGLTPMGRTQLIYFDFDACLWNLGEVSTELIKKNKYTKEKKWSISANP